MKTYAPFNSYRIVSLVCGALLLAFSGKQAARACEQCEAYNNADFEIKNTKGRYHAATDSIVLEITTTGTAGRTEPKPVGKLDGAPVLGYVFPTTLKSTDVGFSATDGTVALALTSHPDFDDSPIWDENGDGVYDNDGRVWHPYWVVLTKDGRVGGGLAVKEFPKDAGSPKPKLPPTAPPMPMFMDSPGYTVKTEGARIRVIIPAARINHQTEFKFDAVTCYLQVNTSDMMMPMLGVMKVYSVASEKLTLPYKITRQ